MNTNHGCVPRILGVIDFGSDSGPGQRLAIRLARNTDALLELVRVVNGWNRTDWPHGREDVRRIEAL